MFGLEDSAKDRYEDWKRFVDEYYQYAKEDRWTFKLKTEKFSRKKFSEWEAFYPYSCTYILESNTCVYIGETGDVSRRSKEHYKEEMKKVKSHHFKRIHIITGNLAETSPTRLLEQSLIILFRLDQKYTVLNNPAGINTNFVRKPMFELFFDDLWMLLAQKGLVKTKRFRNILNSGLVKYSPDIQLTEKQTQPLTSIINEIHIQNVMREENKDLRKPIQVTGGSGSGKTVVATSLFYYLKENEKYHDLKVALVYPTLATRDEMRAAVKQVSKEYAKNVMAPIDIIKDTYDIVICDEAQRLRKAKNLGMYSKNFRQANKACGLSDEGNELDWILLNSRCTILFYDEQQSVCPSDLSLSEYIDRVFHLHDGVRPIKLDEQMRIRAGADYVPYIYDIFYQKATERKTFDNYGWKLFSSYADFVHAVEKKEEEVGLCRLCAGYAWKWNGPDPDKPDICIEEICKKWNRQTNGWLRNEDAKEEVGSIYTLPGVDLNYTGVIVGRELYYDKKAQQIKVNKSLFFDNKVKRGITDEELKIYILKTYGVFFNRGILGTYVYVYDEALREYMSRFIPMA